MTPIADINFVVVDIETTGSSATDDRITDISCIVVKNNEIISTYSSLVNPHKHIPFFIQKMTGITDKMVKNAPEASDIIANVRDLLTQSNTCFVAHNYGFDWKFINETISRENLLTIDVNKICTLKLARKIIPKNVKKNVGDLAAFFNIPILNRHRAFDDAFATSLFFIEILNILKNNYDMFYIEEIIEFQDKKIYRTSKIDKNAYEKIKKYSLIIPETSGIIKFINKEGEILHIAKAKSNMKKHLENMIEPLEFAAKKVNAALKQFARIEWVSTIHELETEIAFNREIKKSKKKNTLFEKEIKTNIINKFSLIAFMLNSEQEKTIDVIIINESHVKKILTLGAKANLDILFNEIHNIFFHKPNNSNILSPDMDEIIIVNNWMKKFQNHAKFLYYENQDELTFCELAEQHIKTFFYNSTKDDEYFLQAFSS